MTNLLLQGLIVLLVFTIYSLVIWGLTRALRLLRVPPKLAILLGFLLFAAGAGLWAALAWPLDSITLINFPAVFLGDFLYQQSINFLGDPHSPQAHFTTPWFFRVPQVHLLASIIFWGLFGLIVQLAYNGRGHISPCLHCYRTRTSATGGHS